ncbi:MAG: hypothetical protein ACRDT4_20995 [Micromonosporaceae bacterium]
MSESLVFPIGHYMGAFHPKTGAPLKYRKVRVGVDVKQLPDDAHFTVWALAHGLPHQIGKVRWTRDAMREIAGIATFDEVVDALVAQGLLAEIQPGQEAAFARGHRLQPLMMGLGNSPDDPLRFSIGFLGVPPAVKVESFVFELWQWGRLGHHLMETAEMFAKVEQEVSGGGHHAKSGPEQLLGEILEQLHVLLAHNAAYLDATLEPASEA